MPEVAPEPAPPPRPATEARRAPVLWVATAVLAGYILAAILPETPPKILAGLAGFFAAGAMVVALRASLTGFRERKICAAWGAAFLIAGTLLAWAWQEVRVPLPSTDWARLPEREATLTLRVTRNFSQKAGSDYAGGLAEVVAAPTVLAELEERNVLFRVRVRAGETPPARGTSIEVTGVLSYLPNIAPNPADPSSEDAARFRAYMHAQGAWFELTRGRVTKKVAPASSWQNWLAAQHEHIEALLRHGPVAWENKYGGIYTALLLGEPSLLDANQREAFTVSGEIYLFAISGLHVGVLAAALWWLLRKIPGLPHVLGEAFTLGVAWLYVEIAGGTPSARRTALMLTFYLLARWFGRARSPLAAIVAAGVATLIVDPLALGNSGFELSFGVVLGLILYAPLLRWAVRTRWRPWRDVPAESYAPWQKCVVWLWDRLMDLVVTSWTAVLCSSALTAEFFGVFSAHVLVLNLIFFPLTCAALWAGAIAVVAGLVGFPPLTWLAWLANAAGLGVVGLMQKIANLAPPLPGLFMHLQIEPARAGSFAALAVLVAMLLAQPKERPPRWWYFALPVGILTGFAVFTVRVA